MKNIINEDLLQGYRKLPLLFTPMVHSTSTVSISLAEVKFNDEEFTKTLLKSVAGRTDGIVCTELPAIAGFASNFGCYPPKPPPESLPPKSNRGRKPNVKPPKKSKHKGTGEHFNSQILFKVTGKFAREKPQFDDGHDGVTIITGHEIIDTKYKVKVFQNGSVTVPGVLDYSMQDLNLPIGDLCRYLRKYMPKTKVVARERVMSNFKFLLIRGIIDLRKVEEMVLVRLETMLCFNVGAIIDQLTKISWIDQISSDLPPMSVDKIIATMDTNVGVYNLRCSREVFATEYAKLPLVECQQFIERMIRYGGFCAEMLQGLAAAYLRPHLVEMFGVLARSNMLLPPSSDEERQPALLLRLRTPTAKNLDRETKIKIFPAQRPPQKIDIEGANNIEEATYIYYWLNHFLQLDKGAIYMPYHYPAVDPDWD